MMANVAAAVRFYCKAGTETANICGTEHTDEAATALPENQIYEPMSTLKMKQWSVRLLYLAHADCPLHNDHPA